MGRLIDEDDVIEIVKFECGDWVGLAKTIENKINALSSEQQWIPCSETVDIPEHEVLCCDKYGEEILGWLAYIDDQWLCESETEVMYDPDAWMEKPEPWKGEQE